MKRFEKWGDELRYRVERIGNDGAGDDEKNAGGVYDMALDLADEIAKVVDLSDYGYERVAEILYNGIKYGEGVK